MIYPENYLERVYAGVLGKLIGVYMGRPVENMRHDQIVNEFGEVRYYLPEKNGGRIVVTDDDIAGTFTFFRAIEDYNFDPGITSAQIGQTWLNYIIENRSILWWGGLYHSSEHTAYLNLKRGVKAPRSGSVEMNGPIIANQIGAQIYIDSWAMTAPGDPERAAELAQYSAAVSHDDQAIYAARLLAAMESQAFIESDLDKLIESGLAQIPSGCLVAILVGDIRKWTLQNHDWRSVFAKIERKYGYQRFQGGCHIIPNLAVVLLALLAGKGDFHESLAIACTCGWDTDCNAGNLGCLLGIRGGLKTFDGGPDWRGPVADRMFLSTADGGRCITDALCEAYRVVNAGRRMQNLPVLLPKNGARFHFSLPGSSQGFIPGLNTRLGNPLGAGLEVTINAGSGEHIGSIATATFILPGDLGPPQPYELQASPTLYPGQTVRALIRASEQNAIAVDVRLFLRYYNALDEKENLYGPARTIQPGDEAQVSWTIPELQASPIFEVGLSACKADANLPSDSLRLTVDWLTWDGQPNTVFHRPTVVEGKPWPILWRRAFVSSLDHWEFYWNHAFRIIQDHGRGVLSTGTREWRDIRVTTRLVSAMFESGGILVCYQGLERYYALELVRPGQIRLLKMLDGERVLAQAEFAWKIWHPYTLVLETVGARLKAWVDGHLIFDLSDPDRPLLEGGIALTVFEGHLATQSIQVEPAKVI